MLVTNSKKKALEGDVVELLEDYPKYNLKKGQRGIVITEFDEPEEAYDLEIEDQQGDFTGFAYSVKPEHIINLTRDAIERGLKHLNDGDILSASKRRYIDALLPASIFIASTTTLLIIYKSFTPRDVNRPLSSDVAIWFTVFTSAIGTFSAIILAWRSDRRDARMKALEIAKLERELAASSEKPALPIPEEKRK